jgi:hypothetical protein
MTDDVADKYYCPACEYPTFHDAHEHAGETIVECRGCGDAAPLDERRRQQREWSPLADSVDDSPGPEPERDSAAMPSQSRLERWDGGLA